MSACNVVTLSLIGYTPKINKIMKNALAKKTSWNIGSLDYGNDLILFTMFSNKTWNKVKMKTDQE